jgi:hypothetical protein
MSHPTRGPALRAGIGGTANISGRRRWGVAIEDGRRGGGEMSHPTRGPALRAGIGGTANISGRRRWGDGARIALAEAEGSAIILRAYTEPTGAAR